MSLSDKRGVCYAKFIRVVELGKKKSCSFTGDSGSWWKWKHPLTMKRNEWRGCSGAHPRSLLLSKVLRKGFVRENDTWSLRISGVSPRVSSKSLIPAAVTLNFHFSCQRKRKKHHHSHSHIIIIRLVQMFRAGAGGWHLWGHPSAKVAPSASLTRPPLKPPSISAAASQPEVLKFKKKKRKKERKRSILIAHGLSHFLQSADGRSLYHLINPRAWRAPRQVEKTGSWRGRRTITQVGMTSPWAGYKAVRTNTQSLE